MQNKAKNLSFILIVFLFAIFAYFVPYKLITSLNDGIILTKDEFNELVNSMPEILENQSVSAVNEADNEKINEYVVKFKLFNLFNIKNVRVKVANNSSVYAGGNCVGLSLKSKGVVIVGSNYIITKSGNFNPLNESGLQIGDVITHLNNIEINSVKDITQILSEYNGTGKLAVVAKRKGEKFTAQIEPKLDVQTKQYKLGVWIRDDAMGVGTLTFVNPETLRFGSLGHAITDIDTGENFEVNNGTVYKCNVVGVKVGKRGVPGEIMGLFMPGRGEQGNVDKNCDNGVYGNLSEDNELTVGKQLTSIGGRLTAKPGKAQILTTIDGEIIETFNIEIIKTNYQTGGSNKSMVIKVTDDELIARTGGIVQGMSGSPIIQNGKIVGAVTHVFVNDPTKGFGIYLDWMLEE